MTTTSPPPHPADERIHKALATANHWTRAALCTLARHGAALRRDDPDRAQHVLDTLAPWPPYKGGQFLFDLLEWEDFMLDGAPPPLLPLEQALTVIGLPLKWLRAAADRIRESHHDDAFTSRPASNSPFPQDLPPLQSGRYLYQDVVLGAWETSCRLNMSLTTPPA
ncbi:hypothetical protein ADK65_33075 [Streptomyces sp. NRRL B-1140]|uniref:hypothetical protein n=1 Tax=Streptomyces sp. NRRL B-1140 TaxID=1415549 RepID=UPI0006AFE03F|nr:hypothetical protein [Streptomyces sp. NRRL B-1140]KOV93324.1 hypothetical protein ADK65_33075 [Streptomyces sp. NRRL B-1140]